MTGPRTDLARARAALDAGELLRPGDVALLFRVSPKTVARWGRAGLLEAARTPGGHRRFQPGPVAELLKGWDR